MKAKRGLPFLFVLLALVSNSANATLIGDEVTCSFSLIGPFGLRVNNEICSTSASAFIPGPSIVGTYTEFFPGIWIESIDRFLHGADVDIGADSIGLIPVGQFTGYMGSFFLDIGSLDWVGESDSVITGVVATTQSLDPTKLTVTYTDHSVHLAIVDTVMQATTRINVQLLRGLPAAVPVPPSLTLAILGLGMLLLHRRTRAVLTIFS